ncbi:hypothetical protein BJX70DRAFT_404483 [Aspergillus crustosus]
MSFKIINVRLVGRWKFPVYGLLHHQYREEITLEVTRSLAGSKTLKSFQLPKGHYEFALEIPLSNVRCETLVGPQHEYHSYRVEVLIQLPGFLARDIIVLEVVKIYRTPNVLLSHGPHTAEECSEQGVQYHVSIPNRAIPHGGAFPVECWFIPESKDARLQSLTMKVIETHALRIEATAAESVQYDTHYITWNERHTVFEERLDIAVRLPQSSDACSQSYRSSNINIEHFLLINAEFWHKDGRPMKLLTQRIPNSIYVAPGRLGEEVVICDTTTGGYCVPPMYGEHELDQVLLEQGV